MQGPAFSFLGLPFSCAKRPLSLFLTDLQINGLGLVTHRAQPTPSIGFDLIVETFVRILLGTVDR